MVFSTPLIFTNTFFVKAVTVIITLRTRTDFLLVYRFNSVAAHGSRRMQGIHRFNYLLITEVMEKTPLSILALSHTDSTLFKMWCVIFRAQWPTTYSKNFWFSEALAIYTRVRHNQDKRQLEEQHIGLTGQANVVLLRCSYSFIAQDTETP